MMPPQGDHTQAQRLPPAGDGYNRRFYAVFFDFERKERCVDDTVHHDSDLN
jgi:hypothetical protein